MPFVSPLLPHRYSLSEVVQKEIRALSDDLDLVLVSKSRTPIFGPLDCLQIERSFAEGFGCAFRFRLVAPPCAVEIDKQRALCARLAERNHKRSKYVHQSDFDYSRIPLFRD